MSQYRKKAAAQARKRRQQQAQVLRRIVAGVVCVAAVITGAVLINGRMTNSVAAPMVLPTQQPYITFAPEVSGATTPDDPTGQTTGTGTSASASWNLLLVNKWHSLPGDFTAPELTVLSNGNSLDKRAYPSLQQMFDDARSGGVYPTVASGYRTAEEQQQILDDRIASYVEQGYSEADARTAALQYAAEPGTSEHRTGLAVDINADTSKSDSDTVYAWLAENSYKYGFILRYPSDKTAITGIEYEPWHFRFVGAEAAQAMHDSGQCLEEYLGVVDGQ